MSVNKDTLQGLREALEYTRGNLDLKTTAVEVTDDEIQFYNIYNKLPEQSKRKLMSYANDLLKVSNA